MQYHVIPPFLSLVFPNKQQAMIQNNTIEIFEDVFVYSE